MMNFAGGKSTDTYVSKYIKALEQVPVLPVSLKQTNVTVVKLARQVRQVLHDGHEELREQLDQLGRYFEKQGINHCEDKGVREVVDGLSRVRFWTAVTAQDAHPTVAKEAQKRQQEIERDLIAAVNEFLMSHQFVQAGLDGKDNDQDKVAPGAPDPVLPKTPPERTLSEGTPSEKSTNSSPKAPSTPAYTTIPAVRLPTLSSGSASSSPTFHLQRKRKFPSPACSDRENTAYAESSHGSHSFKDPKRHPPTPVEGAPPGSPVSSTSSVAMWMPTALIQEHNHLNHDGVEVRNSNLTSPVPSHPPTLPSSMFASMELQPPSWIAAPKPDICTGSQPATPHPLSASIDKHPVTPTASLRYSSQLFQFNDAFEDGNAKTTTPVTCSPRSISDLQTPSAVSTPLTNHTDNNNPFVTHRHARTHSDLAFFQATAFPQPRVTLDTDNICLNLLTSPDPTPSDLSFDPMRINSSIFQSQGFTPPSDLLTTNPKPLAPFQDAPETSTLILRASQELSVEFPNHKTYVNALSFDGTKPLAHPAVSRSLRESESSSEASLTAVSGSCVLSDSHVQVLAIQSTDGEDMTSNASSSGSAWGWDTKDAVRVKARKDKAPASVQKPPLPPGFMTPPRKAVVGRTPPLTPEPSDWSISSHLNLTPSAQSKASPAIRSPTLQTPSVAGSTGILEETNEALAQLKHSIAGSIRQFERDGIDTKLVSDKLTANVNSKAVKESPWWGDFLHLFSRMFACKGKNAGLEDVDAAVNSEVHLLHETTSDLSSIDVQEGTKDESAMRRLYSIDKYLCAGNTLSISSPSPSTSSRAHSFCGFSHPSSPTTMLMQQSLLEGSPMSSTPTVKRCRRSATSTPNTRPSSAASSFSAIKVQHVSPAAVQRDRQVVACPSFTKKAPKRPRWWEDGEDLVLDFSCSDAAPSGMDSLSSFALSTAQSLLSKFEAESNNATVLVIGGARNAHTSNRL